jgi:hypothetical protein
MGAALKAGRRVAYDRTWGLLLLLSCLIPIQLATDSPVLGRFWIDGEPKVSAWLMLTALTAIVALALGLGAFRGRWRHFTNIVLGCTVLALPVFVPAVWETFPLANPARLPIAGLGRIGWVMLLALGAIYVGSGIRVTRPTHFAGAALGTAGALILTLFACMPQAVGGSGYASSKVLLFRDFADHWSGLAPVTLVAAATICSIFNMVRNDKEVALAKAARTLLAGSLILIILLPFLMARGGELTWHAPAAWGAARFFGPLFLAIDGAIAVTAISITRSQE